MCRTGRRRRAKDVRPRRSAPEALAPLCPPRRWAGWGALAAIYMLRVFVVGGFYIVTYALGIFNLNLLVGFLTPKFLPAPPPEEEGPGLPTKNTEEFRPFVRKLPEFKFWWASSRAWLVGLACTLFRFLDFPVFWPVLVLYFLLLTGLTLQRQIQHMRKYKYVPFDIGKPKAGGGGKGGKVGAGTAPRRDL